MSFSFSFPQIKIQLDLLSKHISCCQTKLSGHEARAFQVLRRCSPQFARSDASEISTRCVEGRACRQCVRHRLQETVSSLSKQRLMHYSRWNAKYSFPHPTLIFSSSVCQSRTLSFNPSVDPSNSYFSFPYLWVSARRSRGSARTGILPCFRRSIQVL